MTTIEFQTFKQFQIFFLLLNNFKGLERKEICLRLCLPRTTVYDNLKYLMTKEINRIPYIHYYFYRSGKKGRPIAMFYVPKGISILFFQKPIPEIKVNQSIQDYSNELKEIYKIPK